MVKVYTALTILNILDLYKCNNTLNKGCIRTLRLTYYSIISDLVAYKLRLNMVKKNINVCNTLDLRSRSSK